MSTDLDDWGLEDHTTISWFVGKSWPMYVDSRSGAVRRIAVRHTNGDIDVWDATPDRSRWERPDNEAIHVTMAGSPFGKDVEEWAPLPEPYLSMNISDVERELRPPEHKYHTVRKAQSNGTETLVYERKIDRETGDPVGETRVFFMKDEKEPVGKLHWLKPVARLGARIIGR